MNTKMILLSIQPEHLCNILNGIKKDELRKLFPIDTSVNAVLMYCTKKKHKVLLYNHRLKKYWVSKTIDYRVHKDALNGKVVGLFKIASIDELECEFHNQDSFAKDSSYEAIHRIDRDIDDPYEYDRWELVSNENDWTDEESRNNLFLKRCCLSFNEVKKYMRKGKGYGEKLFDIHIADLTVFDEPLELNRFRKWCGKQWGARKAACLDCKAYVCDPDDGECWCEESHLVLTKAPQNYCYVIGDI